MCGMSKCRDVNIFLCIPYYVGTYLQVSVFACSHVSMQTCVTLCACVLRMYVQFRFRSVLIE